MSNVAIHPRGRPRAMVIPGALLVALLIALAIFGYAITRDHATAGRSNPTPVAHQVSTTPVCVWRHHGWFC
jgi:hypothetical protein